MILIDYAEAAQLADVLAPFLSPQGKIGAYGPTNKLIIKDRTEAVNMLIKFMKRKEDFSECRNFQNGEDETKRGKELSIWFIYIFLTYNINNKLSLLQLKFKA